MFAYCGNNPAMYVDSSGTIPVAFPLMYEEDEDDTGFTASIGISFGFSMFGFFGYSGQICISTDWHGNSQIQGGINGGFTPDDKPVPAEYTEGYKIFQGSLMGFAMFSNAPAVNKLNGPGYQIGGVIPSSPVTGLGIDYNNLEDTETGRAYHGGTVSYGLSTPGFHVTWGQTQRIIDVDFNLFEFFADVQKRRLEMGYV